MLHRLFAFIALVLLLPATAIAAGTVSSADPRASEAGQEMLRKGGSATDAALAMLLALNVVEPQSSGIGGGGFLLHHDNETGLIDSIDGRETAPASASPALFLDAQGQPLPFMQAFPGGKSVGVPGNIALMKLAHDKWGRLPWADLFQPAIALARNGFTVSRPLAAALRRVAPLWAEKFPEAQKLYWIDGKPAEEGATIRNPAFADFLEQIAAQGPDAFYTGAADAIQASVAHAATNATQLTPADLAAYRAKERAAVCSPYRSYRICSMGPPSSGATTVLQILGMLERFDMKTLGKDNPESWHLIGEAMQLAYADRAKYAGDRDFVPVPVAGLLDPAYMRSRSALISTRRARNHYEAGTPPGAQPRTASPAQETPGTTHFVAIDADGNIVSMTSTIEGAFGSQLIARGFFLNNEMTDFDFVPEKDGAPVANRVEPGKRPRSSMAPTIVYDSNGKPVFVVGAAGGPTIIMQVTKAIIAHLDWGLDARDALGMGLLFFRDDELLAEKGTSLEPLLPALAKMGHKTGTFSFPLKANAAERLPDGSWRGAADPRSVGLALTE
ncbi:MAG: gamma-glutamyltransferase [Sphingomonadales bacterium]|nr:MAG: gamma-glutamyltransferase [Sphingomonadales bacterium]